VWDVNFSEILEHAYYLSLHQKAFLFVLVTESPRSIQKLSPASVHTAAHGLLMQTLVPSTVGDPFSHWLAKQSAVEQLLCCRFLKGRLSKSSFRNTGSRVRSHKNSRYSSMPEWDEQNPK
jgi:hypothetical protein